MAVASVDYEKVNMQLLSMLQALNGIESTSVNSGLNPLVISDFLHALDTFRNEIGLEIERQGKR